LADFAEHRFIARLVSDGEIYNFSGQIELLERIANRTVDAADYVAWRKSFGQTGEGLAGDVTGPLFRRPTAL
jgi:hypothetical protein